MAWVKEYSVWITATLSLALIFGGLALYVDVGIAKNEIEHIKTEQTKQARAIAKIPKIETDVALIKASTARIERAIEKLIEINEKNDEKYHHIHRGDP